MILAIVTAAVALIFALTVLQQHRQRPKPYKLVWTVGLVLYSLASLFQFLWQLDVTGAVVFRLWYFTGAMLVASYLGMGTIYLLVQRRVAHGIMGVLLVLTVLGGVLAFATPLQADLAGLEGQALVSVTDDDTRFFPAYVGGLTAFLNSVGALALVGGALWSAYVFWRRRLYPHRVVSNVLIAVGALVSAAGGALERFDLPQPHVLALLIGIVLIYVGFLRSREVFEIRLLPFLRRPSA